MQYELLSRRRRIEKIKVQRENLKLKIVRLLITINYYSMIQLITFLETGCLTIIHVVVSPI